MQAWSLLQLCIICALSIFSEVIFFSGSVFVRTSFVQEPAQICQDIAKIPAVHVRFLSFLDWFANAHQHPSTISEIRLYMVLPSFGVDKFSLDSGVDKFSLD